MHRALLQRHLKGRALTTLGGVAHGRNAIARHLEPAIYIASWISPNKEFSTSRHNASASTSPSEKPPSSGSRVLIFGSAAVAAIFLAAHQSGYIKLPDGNKAHISPASVISGTTVQKPESAENMEENLDFPRHSEDTDLVTHEEEQRVVVQHSDVKTEVAEDMIRNTSDVRESSYEGERQLEEGNSTQFSESVPAEKNAERKTSSEDDLLENKISSLETSQERDSYILKHKIGTTLPDMNVEEEAKQIHEVHETAAASDELVLPNMPQGKEDEVGDKSLEYSLSENYLLQDERSQQNNTEQKEMKVPVGHIDTDTSKDGKLVLDFIEAIHAAERKQAESDAHLFAEEKQLLEEKYKKELKDAWARELMYAEEAASLNKELSKERARSSASIKLLQEKAEAKLKIELEQKEKEAELELEKAKELAKVEIAAAIASEKSSQLEKLAEANLHINALCMAFYARSEEARQSHSVHKLVLGILALEDALAKGLPIGKEISSLQSSVEGIDKDSFLDFVLSSLPDETLNFGTYTHLQLSQKFEALKRTLRHLTLIPAGGGGLLAHSLAFVTSLLKVKEDAESSKGIESVISQVQRLLAEGRLPEAAEALELGVSGSQAEGLASEWVRLARNRAITEQALSLLQSYATAVSAT